MIHVRIPQKRLPRRAGHAKGGVKLGQSPIYCGYYTISGSRESGFPAALAAESRPQPGRSGVTGAGRGVCRAGHAKGGVKLGQSPIYCGYYTIIFPKSRQLSKISTGLAISFSSVYRALRVNWAPSHEPSSVRSTTEAPPNRSSSSACSRFSASSFASSSV